MNLVITYILALLAIFIVVFSIGIVIYTHLLPKNKNVNVTSTSFALLLGTSLIILLTNLFSNLGLDIKKISVILIIFTVLLAMISWKRINLLRINKHDAIEILLYLAICFLGSLTCLAPILLENSYTIIGDPYTYISISEYLQTHGIRPFLTNTEIVNHPFLSQTYIYQYSNFRIGAMWVLSLVENLMQRDAVFAFPLATVWGIYLCSTTIYLFINKFVKDDRAKLLYLLIFNVLGNPILSGATMGFLPQTFGIAGFLMCIFLAEELIDLDFRALILFSIFLSYLTSVYSELVPFTLIIVILVNLVTFIKRWKSNPSTLNIRAIIVKVFFTFSTWIIFSNIEFLRFLLSINRQINAVVGWHISMKPFEWLSFGFGFRGSGIELSPISYFIQIVFCLAAIVLLVIYFIHCLLQQRFPISILVTIGVFALFLVYFGIKKDPWTQEPGQTWSIYKLAQWFYVGVFILQVSAFEDLSLMIFKRMKLLPLIMVLSLVVIIYIPSRINNIKEISSRNEEIFLSQSPIIDLTNLSSKIKEMNPNDKTIVIISENTDLWPKVLYTYFLRDEKIISNWRDISYFPYVLQEYHPVLQVDNAICLLVESSSSINHYDIIQELPANAAIVRCTPELLNMSFPYS